MYPNGMIINKKGQIQWYGTLFYYKNFHIMGTFTVYYLIAVLLIGLFMSALVSDLVMLLMFSMTGVMLLPIFILAYYFNAVLHGGTTVYLYTMDEDGIHGKMEKKSAKINRSIAFLTILLGSKNKNIGTVGIGMSSMQTDSYISFKKANKVSINYRAGYVKVKYKLFHKYIYCYPEQLEYVATFVENNCFLLEEGE